MNTRSKSTNNKHPDANQGIEGAKINEGPVTPQGQFKEGRPNLVQCLSAIVTGKRESTPPLSSSSPRRPVSVLGRIFDRTSFQKPSFSPVNQNSTKNTYVLECSNSGDIEQQDGIEDRDQTINLEDNVFLQQKNSLEWDRADVDTSFPEDDISLKLVKSKEKEDILSKCRSDYNEVENFLSNQHPLSIRKVDTMIDKLTEIQEEILTVPMIQRSERQFTVSTLEQDIQELTSKALSIRSQMSRYQGQGEAPKNSNTSSLDKTVHEKTNKNGEKRNGSNIQTSFPSTLRPMSQLFEIEDQIVNYGNPRNSLLNPMQNISEPAKIDDNNPGANSSKESEMNESRDKDTSFFTRSKYSESDTDEFSDQQSGRSSKFKECHSRSRSNRSDDIVNKFISKKAFEQRMKGVEEMIETKLTSARLEWQEDISNFIKSSEARIAEVVHNKISEDYNKIGIKCIESKNAIRRSLNQFQISVNNEFLLMHGNNNTIKDNQRIIINQMNQIRDDLNKQTNSQSFSIIEDKEPEIDDEEPTTIRMEDKHRFSRQHYNDNPQDEEESIISLDETPKRKITPLPKRIIETSKKKGTIESERSVDSINSSKESSFKSQRLLRKIKVCGGQVKEIIKEEINEQTSRARIIEISSFELVTLKALKKEFEDLERKAEKEDLIQAMDYIDTLLEEIKKWEMQVSQQRREKHLHLSSEKSLLKNINLPKFDGSSFGPTVYSFLSTFFRFAEAACSPEDQATLLFTSYLSDQIKGEVESFQTDIKRIKTYLIDRYGDLRDIADSRSQAIAQLKHPNQTDTAQIEYYKKVYQSLLQVESLCQADLVNRQELNNVVFTSTYVRQLVSHLPESILDKFSEKLEEESMNGKPNGDKYFTLLKSIINQKWKKLNTKCNIRSMKESGATVSKQKTYNEAEINVASRSLVFPCPFHKDSKHDLGYCREFMTATNKTRGDMCYKNKTCWTCFQPNCFKNNSRNCVSLAALPKGFICEDCFNNTTRGNPRCILTCPHPEHKKVQPDEMERLTRSYLKVIDSKLLSEMISNFNFIMINKAFIQSHTVADPPASKSTFDRNSTIPAFDTNSGEKINTDAIRFESSYDCVYVYQHIMIANQEAIVFYDSGASGNLVRGEFAEMAGFKTIDPENQRISGVSNISMWTGYGIYSCSLGPDKHGDWWQLGFQGIEKITSVIPKYSWAPLNNEVNKQEILSKEDILPPCVGGREVDIILGLRQSELVPSLEFSLPSGLGCYRCPFTDINGSSLAYGGSHHLITSINKTFGNVSVNQLAVLLTQTMNAYRGSPWMTAPDFIEPKKPLTMQMHEYTNQMIEATPLTALDIEQLGGNCPKESAKIMEIECQHTPKHVCLANINKAKVPLSKLRQILDPEEPLISYRCEDCEQCKKCIGSAILKSASVRERYEGRLIEESVRLDYINQSVVIKLPFTVNIDKFLVQHFRGDRSNKAQALAVYKQQTRKSPEAKELIRGAFEELKDLGFIAPLEEASPEIKKVVESSVVIHYHIWRALIKNSITTPVRILTDPSSTMLNLALAKADSGLNSMFSILLRFRSSVEAWSSDVTKLYNQLHLDESCAPYSLLLYHSSLDESIEPQQYRMCRGWYGISSTGPQAAVALRRAGEDHTISHPQGAKALKENLYVDDVNDGQQTIEECHQQVKEVQQILSHIGMKLKYIAYSKSPPPPKASKDGERMTVLGMNWFPESDMISIKIPEVNFNEKKGGTRAPNNKAATDKETVRELCKSLPKMTRKHVAAKIGEFYDAMGIGEPIKAHYKRSAARLNHLDFKDVIDDEEKTFWTNQFILWPEIANMRFPRSTIPETACFPYELRIIVCSDASDTCGGAAVYVCYHTQSGEWSSMILTARSQLMKYSVPRNELLALMMAAESAYATVVSLNRPIKEVLIVTDSLVSLCWVSNERSRNKVYVQNQVHTIRRYMTWIQERCGNGTTVDIAHINGNVNPADKLTKGNIGLKDIAPESKWFQGYPWMNKEQEQMPLTRFQDVSLSKTEFTEYLDEVAHADPNFDWSKGYLEQENHLIYVDQELERGSICSLNVNPLKEKGVSHFSCFRFQDETKDKLLVDIVHKGWLKGNRILSVCISYLVILFHKTHMKTLKFSVKKSMARRCKICRINMETLGKSCLPLYEFINSEETDKCPYIGPYIDGNIIISDEDIFKSSKSVGSEHKVSCNHTTTIVNKGTQLDMVQIIIDEELDEYDMNRKIVVEDTLNYYWNITATKECLENLSKKEMKNFELKDNVLFYKSRLSNEQQVSVHDLDMLELNFLGSKPISFHSPCVWPQSQILYAFCMYIHFTMTVHGGVESTLAEIQNRFHVINGRRIVAAIIKDCVRCKIIKKKTLDQAMKNHHCLKLTFSPAFCFISIDLAQDFNCKIRFNARDKQTMRCPALVSVCITTGAVSIFMCENWSTESVIAALNRHSNRYGAPNTVFIDQGSQLKKIKEASFKINDFINNARCDGSLKVVVSTAKSHESQGKVEKKICIIKDMISKLGRGGNLLSFLGWETLFSHISNHLNSIPVCRSSGRSVVSKEYTIITPNMLLLGHSNKRSLVGPMVIDSSPTAILDKINGVQESFFRLLVKQIHLLVPRPKWFDESSVEKGDVVLFFTIENAFHARNQPWKYGKVVEIDGTRLTLEYTAGESFQKKEIVREKRNVVRLAHESELDFNSDRHKERVFRQNS